MNDISKNVNLKSIAQRRSFWGRLNEPLERSSFSMERKIVEVDDLIREIALNHGSTGSSLSDDIKLAKKAFNDERLIDVRKHLADYNQALFDIITASDELLKLGEKFARTEFNIKKYAGFFDLFKSKKEEPSFEKKHREAISDKKEGIKEFLTKSIDNHNKIKNIFDKLDKARVKRNVQEYIKELLVLDSEQKDFNASFNKANEKFFNPLFEMRRYFGQAVQEEDPKKKIQEELKGMKEELFSNKEKPIAHEPFTRVKIDDPNKPISSWMGYDVNAEPPPFSGLSIWPMSPLSLNQIQSLKLPENFNDFTPPQIMTSVKINRTDYCPCGSGAVWGRCHGKDEDKINQIAEAKGISIEKAEKNYFKNIADAVRRKIKKQEAFDEKLERFKEHQRRSNLDPFYTPDPEMLEMESYESPLASQTRKSILEAITTKQKRDKREFDKAERAAKIKFDEEAKQKAIEDARKLKEMKESEKVAHYSKSSNRIKLARYLISKY